MQLSILGNPVEMLGLSIEFSIQHGKGRKDKSAALSFKSCHKFGKKKASMAAKIRDWISKGRTVTSPITKKANKKEENKVTAGEK
jgi:hypothetical protein